MSTAEVKEAGNAREVVVDADTEFRFEVSFDQTVHITLLRGNAELFGTELCVGRKYAFSGCKNAIFSYQGATISVSGNCAVEYTSNETPMMSYLNTHLALERKRGEAKEEKAHGPNVLVLGTSRNTLTRILLNYAVRVGHQPLWIDLDIANGSLMFPGVIGALPVDRPIDIEEGPPMTSPLTYFYGHAGGGAGGGGLSTTSTGSGASAPSSSATSSSSQLPLENPKLYRLLLARLAQQASNRLDADEKARVCGTIITSLGWADHPLAFELLQLTLELFKVKVLIVVGNERLHSDLTKRLSSFAHLTVLKIAKSGGWVQKDAAFRRLSVASKIRHYFYGVKAEYSPFPIVQSFKDLHVRRIGEGPVAPSSALPLGATRKVDETRIVRVELLPGPAVIGSSTKEGSGEAPVSIPNTVHVSPHSLLHMILALSNAAAEEEAKIIEDNVLGFVYVTEVDDVRKRLTLLAPCPGKLPRPYLLLGSIRWMEK